MEASNLYSYIGDGVTLVVFVKAIMWMSSWRKEVDMSIESNAKDIARAERGADRTFSQLMDKLDKVLSILGVIEKDLVALKVQHNDMERRIAKLEKANTQ